MSEGMEKSEGTVDALAKQWKELFVLHANGEYPDQDFKRAAWRIHSKIYDFINEPKTKEAGEALLQTVYGDVGEEFFNEEQEN